MTVTSLPKVMSTVDQSGLRDCLARWPSGVTVVTTVDAGGVDRGFTATAFSALSMSPPTVLVCLDRNAQCRPAFNTAPTMAIHVLRDHQRDLALRFATKGVDKFEGLATERGIGGAPLLPGCLGRLECRITQRIPGGDHIILIGLVCAVETAGGSPLVYFERGFHGL